MSGILSKWVVQAEYAVTGAGGAGGAVSDETVRQWVEAACATYLDRCGALRRAAAEPGCELRTRITVLPSGGQLGGPDSVLVTATASQFRPASVSIAVRLRPLGGPREDPVNARCEVSLVEPATGEARELGTEIRDELIALEHAAEHFN